LSGLSVLFGDAVCVIILPVKYADRLAMVNVFWGLLSSYQTNIFLTNCVLNNKTPGALSETYKSAFTSLRLGD